MTSNANAPARDRGAAAFVLADGPQHSAGAPGRPDVAALDGELIPPPSRHLSEAEAAAWGAEARAEHDMVERSLKDAVKHAVAAGRVLLRAKERLGYGLFGDWLKRRARLHPRTRQRYMLLARELPKLPKDKATRVSQLSLRDAVGELARLSRKATSLPTPVLDRALVDARREPLKQAVTRAFNGERYAPPNPASAVPRAAVEVRPSPGVEAPPDPPSDLVSGILGHCFVYRRECPETSDAEILEALNEAYCRVQAGALGADPGAGP